MDRRQEAGGGRWTLLTGHGHVLVEIARNPRARIRDIAAAAGVTERTAQAIIADLDAAGYVTRTRAGRRTVYTVHLDCPFRHPAQEGHRVGPFLKLLTASGDHMGDAAVSLPRGAWITRGTPPRSAALGPGRRRSS